MVDNFDKACAIILSIEGGYINDTADIGGETKYGISKKSYPNLDIRNLSEAEAKEIYRKDYWYKIKADKINDASLALYYFDCAVNQGCIKAIKLMQEFLNITPDGLIGDITLNKLNSQINKPSYEFLSLRAIEYMKIPTFSNFGRGWCNRLFKIALSSINI